MKTLPGLAYSGVGEGVTSRLLQTQEYPTVKFSGGTEEINEYILKVLTA